MEFYKPAKGALSLGKFTYDIKANLRNKITFAASPQNDKTQKRKKYTEANQGLKKKFSDKFSSAVQFNQPNPNCIENLKYVSNKPVISSQTVPAHYMDNSLSHMPVYHKVLDYFKNIAITDSDGDFLYEDVFRRACRLSKEIVSVLKGDKIDQKICVLCPNGLSFVVAQWATWMTGNIFVPLSRDHSLSALEYFIKDCKASLIIGTNETSDTLNVLSKKMEVPLLLLDKTWTSNPVKEFEESLDCEIFDQIFYAERHTALLLYAATKNGSPAGMLYRHYNLNAQADGIAEVWDLDQKSSVLNALPNNRTYGIISSLLAPLSVGGRVVMMDKFDSVQAWAYLLGVGYNGDKEKYPRTTVDILSSTPEQYCKLLQRYQEMFKDPKMKDFVYTRCRKAVRLMLCSNAELPADLAENWRQITGHSILQSFSKPQHTGTYVKLLRGKRQSTVIP